MAAGRGGWNGEKGGARRRGRVLFDAKVCRCASFEPKIKQRGGNC